MKLLNPVLLGLAIGGASVAGLACTDAGRSNMLSMGSAHTITCYSGGQRVYTATSTGKVVANEGGSFSFEDAHSHRHVAVTMDCVVTVAP